MAANDIESTVFQYGENIAGSKWKKCNGIVVLPVNEVRYKRLGRNEQIKLVNQRFAELAARMPNVNFKNHTALFDRNQDGDLDDDLHIGDGLHLNEKGYSILSNSLQQAIRKTLAQAE